MDVKLNGLCNCQPSKNGYGANSFEYPCQLLVIPKPTRRVVPKDMPALNQKARVQPVQPYENKVVEQLSDCTFSNIWMIILVAFNLAWS